MESTPLVSVVVPAYNAEPYIRRCVESLGHQTLRDIEIIVVDDGSTDRTAAIVGSINDPRIRLVSKANGGVSSAKNAGLDVARGQFIQLLDSDDWIEADALQCLTAIALEGGYDIVATDIYLDHPGQPPKYCRSSSPSAEWTSKRFVLSEVIRMKNTSWMVTRLYRKHLFDQEGMRFDCDLHLSEDRLLDLKLFQRAASVHKVDRAFAHYVQSEGSLTRRADPDYWSHIETHWRIRDFLGHEGIAAEHADDLLFLEYRTVFLELVYRSSMRSKHLQAYRRIAGNVRRYLDNEEIVRHMNEALDWRMRALVWVYMSSPWLGRLLGSVLRCVKQRVKARPAPSPLDHQAASS
jgi:glycosyltransferase involved in cell wall biosynthesis